MTGLLVLTLLVLLALFGIRAAEAWAFLERVSDDDPWPDDDVMAIADAVQTTPPTAPSDELAARRRQKATQP